MVASLGSLLRSLLTVALLVLGVILFLPRGIFPEQLSTAIFAGSYPFGPKVLVIAVLGTMACIGGAAVETALSGASNLCQFYNSPWGKNMPAKSVPIYTATWIGILVLALIIAVSGVSTSACEHLDHLRHGHHAVDLLPNPQSCSGQELNGQARQSIGRYRRGRDFSHPDRHRRRRSRFH